MLLTELTNIPFVNESWAGAGEKSHYREEIHTNVPDADALMNPTKGLKDEESSVFNKILKACNQKEVIYKNLKKKRYNISK